MYHPAHAAQVVFALGGFALHALDVCRVGQSVGLADGIHILLCGHRYIEELAAYAAVYLLITFLVVAQAVLHAALDVVGTQEDNARLVLQAVVDADEVAEHAVRQLVALVEDDEWILQEGYHGDGILQDVAQVGAIDRSAHLLGYLAHEVALPHVLGAEDVEHVAVRAAVLDGGGGLATSGVAHHPGGEFVGFRIGHGKGDAAEGVALGQRPAFEAVAYLGGDATEHVVADVLIALVADLRHGGGAHAVQAFAGTVLRGVIAAIFYQGIADGVFVLDGQFFHCLNGI